MQVGMLIKSYLNELNFIAKNLRIIDVMKIIKFYHFYAIHLSSHKLFCNNLQYGQERISLEDVK